MIPGGDIARAIISAIAFAVLMTAMGFVGPRGDPPAHKLSQPLFTAKASP